MSDTTWRRELDQERANRKDDSPIIAIAPDVIVLDQHFDDDYGGTEGQAFLAWSERFVYFPVCYDGAEWVGSAPRNPTPEGQDHVGGG